MQRFAPLVRLINANLVWVLVSIHYRLSPADTLTSIKTFGYGNFNDRPLFWEHYEASLPTDLDGSSGPKDLTRI
jgi:hypothetical protein